MKTQPMFEKTVLTVLVQAKGTYRELVVYSMEGELFAKNGSGYNRILSSNRTSGGSEWVRFSNGMIPTFNRIGWAKAGGRWKKEPKRTKVK